ncbi:MAG: DUF3135 domain-containing protein [Proteobacteria bacterium]|nr:DUF3135 domain-containing protein [Pseudomonadota bacterium]
MKANLPDFEVLVEMAREDPDALDGLRRELTERVIDGAPNEVARHRLMGLQFRIDMVRRKATNPMSATIRISEMMCQSLYELQRSILAPQEIIDENTACAALPDNSQVIPFRPR